MKISYEKWRYFLLWFMVAIFPLMVIPGPFNYFTGPRYFVLAVIAFTAFYLLFLRGGIRWHRAYLPLGFFVLFSLLSAALAEDLVMAVVGNSYRFTGFSTYLFCITLFVLALQCRGSDGLVKYMVMAAAVASFTGILQYFGVNIVPLEAFRSVPLQRAIGTIGNANWFATYGVFLLPAALLSHSLFRKGTWLACLALIYGGLLVNLTRYAWLTFAVSFLLISVYLLNHRDKRRILFHAVLVLVVVTLVLLPTRDGIIIKQAFSISDEVSSAVQLEGRAGSNRLDLWRETLAIARENWAFGVGPDHLELETPGGYATDKSHNIYLEVGATMGVFALLSYLAFLSFFFRRWKDQRGFLFFMMIFTYLLQGVFLHDVIMVMPLFWIVLGLTLSHQQETMGVETGEVTERNPVLQKVVFGLVAGLILFYLGFAVLLWTSGNGG